MIESLKTVIQKSVDFFFESVIGTTIFIVFLFISAIMLVVLLNQKHPSSFTVMITNVSESNGGSGSIIETSKDLSFILTNAHICNVIKFGGIVKKEDGSKFMATAFIKSSIHDLCIIEVAADLGDSVKIANQAQQLILRFGI